MSLFGYYKYLKITSGETIEVNRGLFHTHVILPDGSELELDCDFDDLMKLLDK